MRRSLRAYCLPRRHLGCTTADFPACDNPGLPHPGTFARRTLKNLLVSLDRLADFDEIVDVRTPLEFAEDHIPGALNAPVLSNEERVLVGTMYKQVSPFEATRVGAALVARNLAQHLDTTFADRPRNWRPLIYCWRGGNRSGSMTTLFNMIGWQARQLEGGYKSYRRATLDTLDHLPATFRYIALTGPTGSGKTRLLHALHEAGAQTLDLEQLAAHRGSLLGALPGEPQPSQKWFDTLLVGMLRDFDPARPVFVEAESRRIGAISLPLALLESFHRGACVVVEASHEDRAAFLLHDYAHLFHHPESFKQQLSKLVGLHSRERVSGWHALIDQGREAELARELIDLHYDPAYARSSRQNFSELPHATHMLFRPNDADVVEQARALLARLDALRAAETPPVTST
ncbi:MAG: tRNA 2-selenouridine synthase [Caballeronia mineralivorans]|jgi:tRNA 2-selenouridine synthase|nr:tRNA 2-selenouridine synthase [Caballeronia mineralivorans]